MTKSPYEILGVSPSASPDEIKKAYRKKARENHPDLHPDDPHAADRMNEINEAYDRLSNPEKYEQQDRRRSAAQGPYGGPAGAAGSSGFGGYGNPYTSAQGSAGGQRAQGPYTQGSAGPYGWSGVGFGWDDFFDFAGAATGPVRPEASSQDSPDVIRAINLINSNHFEEAAKILQSIPSTGRDARWHYLIALANHGAGNTMLANDQIRKAIEMDPENPDYQRAYNNMRRTGNQYTQESVQQGFTIGMGNPLVLCCGCLALQMFCFPVACCPVGFIL